MPCVRADNDAANGPMLHINAQLGYQPIPGPTTYRKRLARAVAALR